MPKSAAQVIDALGSTATVALTAWAEARGDWREGQSSVEERIAVIWTIMRRSERRNQSVKEVCLAPKQFSCWAATDGEANHKAVMALARAIVSEKGVSDALYLETRYLVEGVLCGVILDRTGGADHYYAPKAMIPRGRVPGWAKGKTPSARIGDQVFYNLEGR